MLDLDLDLEADLGVDTVKQAEMFAAIREVYGIPRDENLKLRDFPTLAHTIQLVYDRWREANRIRVKRLSVALRALYEAIGGPGTFLVSATRLGGRHGVDLVAPLRAAMEARP